MSLKKTSSDKDDDMNDVWLPGLGHALEVQARAHRAGVAVQGPRRTSPPSGALTPSAHRAPWGSRPAATLS